MKAMRLPLSLLSLLLSASTCCSAATVLTGAGSTAAEPLYNKLAEAYIASGGPHLYYQGIGSSAGIVKVKRGAVDFGASDVAANEEALKKDKLVGFPTAIGGVVPAVNILGIKGGDLQLTGEVLADIFSRKIETWNDAAIAVLNPHLHLPRLPITVVVRQDGSGTTYNFSDYLNQVSTGWAQHFGRGFTISWPESTTQVKGSGEVAKMVARTSGAIGYVDFKFIRANKLVYVKLRNRDGKFVAPSAASFAEALKNSNWSTTARYEEMLTNRPGLDTWPITAGTFVLVPRVAMDPERAITTLKFFMWGFLHGDGLVEESSFVRLPDKVQGRIFAEMTKVTDREGKPLHWSLAPLLNTQ
jgi:phosphate transport system substrate-binding protein